jgi:membrane protein YqaA with SNARE-associated domain
MMAFLDVFLTWWGVIILGALDTSLFFFIPFGTDAAVIYLSARDRDLFWLYPLLTTAGSLAGAAVTYTIGARLGDQGLTRFIPAHRLDNLRRRVEHVGAWTMGLTALLPPPFPLTAFVLTSGALKVALTRFLLVFGVARLFRFGVEGVLARRYGTTVVRMLESETAQRVAIGLVIVSILGTVITIARVWHLSRHGEL